MKYWLLLLTIITFSCADTQPADSRTISYTNSSPVTNSLIGHWTICSTISGTGDSLVSTSYNVCTIVNFNSDNTATVIKPSGDSEFLEWKISNDKLVLTNKNPINTDEVYFDNGEYEMTFTKQQKYTELKLSQRQKNYTYVLGGN